MEFLLGLFLGYLLFNKDSKSYDNSRITHCKPANYPRPPRLGDK